MAIDSTKTASLSLKLSNLYANGRIIIYADGTGRMIRDIVDYKPAETDDYYVVTINDVITRIAYRFYKDKVLLPSHYWWIIADANNIRNPLDLSGLVSKEIVIPNILNFKLVNQ